MRARNEEGTSLHIVATASLYPRTDRDTAYSSASTTLRPPASWLHPEACSRLITPPASRSQKLARDTFAYDIAHYCFDHLSTYWEPRVITYSGTRLRGRTS